MLRQTWSSPHYSDFLLTGRHRLGGLQVDIKQRGLQVDIKQRGLQADIRQRGLQVHIDKERLTGRH